MAGRKHQTMVPEKTFTKISPSIFVGLVLTFVSISGVFAQSIPEPQRDHTLNGLTVLLDKRPADPNMTLTLRIQSGSSFDTVNKGGTMAIMSDLLFPDPTTREFITDELKGKLETSVGFDSIDVVMSGRAAEFERLVQFMRTALTGNAFTPEDFERIKEARIKFLRDTHSSASATADLAISSRLFGLYPYGHPPAGTPESLSLIAIGDVIHARERFLNPNNAVLVVSGSIDSDRVMRALRQLLGGWRKSESIAPQTFRQPSEPDERILIVAAPGNDNAEVRLAVRGLSRSDKDYYASQVLAELVKMHWMAGASALSKGPTFVRSQAFVLPGVFVLGSSVPAEKASTVLLAAKRSIELLSTTAPSPEDFGQAKTRALADFQTYTANAEGLAKMWLNSETYELPSVQSQIDSFNAVTAEDVFRVAGRLFQKRPVALVAAGNEVELTRIFSADEKFKIQTAPLPSPVKTTNSKPVSTKP